MAAPEYVSKPSGDRDRVYESPNVDPETWLADRPAELVGRQPAGPRFGNQGPDQGFALKLAGQFRGRLVLTPGEHEDDAIVGCVEVANKRASIFGRAPMIHDLTLAFTLFGFLSEVDPDLVALRKPYFAAVHLPAHYTERRQVSAIVPESTLRLSLSEFKRQAEGDPKRIKLLTLPATV